MDIEVEEGRQIICGFELFSDMYIGEQRGTFTQEFLMYVIMFGGLYNFVWFCHVRAWM